MSQNNAYSLYKENSVFTSNPEELVLMLYNGVIKFVLQAQKSVEDNDLPTAHDKIIRAQDIIIELKNSLDMQYEVSNGMSLLYDYMHRRLIDANIKKDNTILEEVLGLAREFRDTWSEAIKIARSQGMRQAQ